jgi:hypothetical protein
LADSLVGGKLILSARLATLYASPACWFLHEQAQGRKQFQKQAASGRRSHNTKYCQSDFSNLKRFCREQRGGMASTDAL